MHPLALTLQLEEESQEKKSLKNELRGKLYQICGDNVGVTVAGSPAAIQGDEEEDSDDDDISIDPIKATSTIHPSNVTSTIDPFDFVSFSGNSFPFNRNCFPSNFMFGVASSAYQFEGAAMEDGKAKSIWDTFTHIKPSKIKDGSNGDVAADFYHRYKDDVKLLKSIGMDALRFSISWPRVLRYNKNGESEVNEKGITFYNNLINELITNGIKPVVTLFHFDTPQALEDNYLGFLSDKIVNDFGNFAELCFKKFGDRVKHWITINEPQTFCHYGYDYGEFAPGRCSAFRNKGCVNGDSATEPYKVGHNLLLAHAEAVKIYKKKYQASQKGEIGITLSTYWFEPYSKSKPNVCAATRALDFFLGWFLHPLTYGTYPESMRTIVKKRLPEFTPEQAKMVKGSFDFIGLNYYTGLYASDIPDDNNTNPSYTADMHAKFTIKKLNGKRIGIPTGVSTFSVYPQGFWKLLISTKKNYNNPTIYVTETGLGDADVGNHIEGTIDGERIYFFHQHLLALRKAMNDGVKVKGLFAWAFLDNMEWSSGYTIRFGIIYVDFKNLKRYLKWSAFWFKKFLLK